MSARETLIAKTNRVRKAVLPGFDGAPLDLVVKLIVKGLFGRGVLVTRASSIAFNMLMALLPASIFLFTLIPFIPVPNFQAELVKLFENFLPVAAYDLLETTIIDVITNRSGTLLIVMFIATIIFSTNGIHALMHAFNVSMHDFASRSWIQQRKIAVFLLVFILIMFSAAGGLIILSRLVVNRLVDIGVLEMNLVFYIVMAFKWLLIIVMLFFAISTLYYLVPARRKDFRYISPGSILATSLFIITSLAFSAYVNNFGQYNKLYGSIGTLIVILIWLYLNSVALLVGFELNVSIRAATCN
ncbi:MAG TPA: YihY/virulence factor BrkB family protein, partial [Bacteroidales bacterium]|nr:YihY/virulence factor BrkB family protein [Bacteroidales bacterium]HPS98895.1 YihY/virulence factor BrkB family protein [Bacteroidales bacterium]